MATKNIFLLLFILPIPRTDAKVTEEEMCETNTFPQAALFNPYNREDGEAILFLESSFWTFNLTSKKLNEQRSIVEFWPTVNVEPTMAEALCCVYSANSDYTRFNETRLMFFDNVTSYHLICEDSIYNCSRSKLDDWRIVVKLPFTAVGLVDGGTHYTARNKIPSLYLHFMDKLGKANGLCVFDASDTNIRHCFLLKPLPDRNYRKILDKTTDNVYNAFAALTWDNWNETDYLVVGDKSLTYTFKGQLTEIKLTDLFHCSQLNLLPIILVTIFIVTTLVTVSLFVFEKPSWVSMF